MCTGPFCCRSFVFFFFFIFFPYLPLGNRKKWAVSPLCHSRLSGVPWANNFRRCRSKGVPVRARRKRNVIGCRQNVRYCTDIFRRGHFFLLSPKPRHRPPPLTATTTYQNTGRVQQLYYNRATRAPPLGSASIAHALDRQEKRF